MLSLDTLKLRIVNEDRLSPGGPAGLGERLGRHDCPVLPPSPYDIHGPIDIRIRFGNVLKTLLHAVRDQQSWTV